jgi:hypothetical protein
MTNRRSVKTLGILLSTLGFVVVGAVPAGANHTTMTRQSVSTAGAQANGRSENPALSYDGRYLAFGSWASNLITGDLNGASDIFRRDVTSGTTTRVSVSSAGAEANNSSYAPSISSSGTYIAFYSLASNLVANDTNGAYDVFFRDMKLNPATTTRLSVSSSGVEANGASYSPSLSADGRYVAFRSRASNLVSGDTNGTSDIFVRDRTAGTTIRVSVDSAGAQANADCWDQAISGDGRYVAFRSAATNLVLGDTNLSADIFLRDTQAGTTTRVSVDSNGLQGLGDSYAPALSSDGRYVAFESVAPNLVVGDANAASDVFVRDRTAAKTTRVSLSGTGAEANGGSYRAAMSSDGRYIYFSSDASNLVTGDVNASTDAFVRDTAVGSLAPTFRASLSALGVEGNSGSYEGAISGDGRYVAFRSFASNLVSGDTNAEHDVFVRDRGEVGVPSVSLTVSEAAFSPNGDSVKETTTFSGSITDDSPPIAWTLAVRNAAGLAVRSWSGTGASSPTNISQVWDGRNSNGLTVIDGSYTATLTATDDWGNVGSSPPVIVKVDTLPPLLAGVSPVDGGNAAHSPLKIHAVISDVLSGVSATTIAVSVSDASASPPTAIPLSIESFDGVTGLLQTSEIATQDLHRYSVRFTATDLVGNSFSDETTFLANRWIPLESPEIRVSYGEAIQGQLNPTSGNYVWTIPRVRLIAEPYTLTVSGTLSAGWGAVPTYAYFKAAKVRYLVAGQSQDFFAVRANTMPGWPWS